MTHESRPELNTPWSGDLPSAFGLYDPANEHDACGVSFVVDIKGRASHEIVAMGIGALCNLEHRGASGAEANTGDGAGITIQIPDRFLRAVVDFALPPAGAIRGRDGVPADRGGRHRAGRLAHREDRRQRGIARPRMARRAGRRLDDRRRRSRRSCRSSASCSSAPRKAADRPDDARAARVRGAQARRARGRQVASTSRASRRARSSTRGCSPRRSCRSSSPTSPTSGSSRRSRSSTRASPPTRSRRGRSRTRTATSPTTARSTRSRATATGCARARRCSRATASPATSSRIFPICTPGGSDTASFDEVLELLHLGGRSLPHAVLMMIPEAWENHAAMSAEKRAFYRVPRVAHGAMGRPGVDRVHRRHRRRRGARPQRPAPEPLLGDRRRPRDHGERGRRPRHRSGTRREEGPPAARDGCSSSTRATAASSTTTRSRRTSRPSFPTRSGCTAASSTSRTCPTASTSSTATSR